MQNTLYKQNNIYWYIYNDNKRLLVYFIIKLNKKLIILLYKVE